jgi:hypothetical protein
MSIKKLFDKGKTSKVVSSTDLERLSEDIESSENLEQRFKDIDRFVPSVDFANPENFARFASAEKYYTDAMDRIVRYYPYDGSEAELNEFHNESSYIDKYIFDNLYPRTTGYAKFGRWGDTDTSPVAATLYYGEPTAKEYIEVKGGPHTASYGMPSGSLGSTFTGSNYYSTDIYNQAGKSPSGRDGTRESNLRMSLDDGITVEFWLKKESFIAAKTQKEVIFDLWNQVTSSDSRHGRLTIELTASSFAENGANPFRFTFVSGSVAGEDNNQGAGFQDLPLGGTTITTASVADNKWHHYALSVSKTGSNNTVRFYRDGEIVTTIATGSTTGEITGSLIGFIGALQTHPNLPIGTTIPADGMTGWGKLSGSIDEFRYWKVRRTSEEIKKNYYTQVRGGTNTDTANAELGVYYKFNEGVTGDSTLDSTVLDYSGRISNGTWVGYAAGSRSTGSAIVESSGSNKVEYRDPIIYPTHADVSALRSNLVASASYHDIRNSSAIYHSMPSWIIEDDDENAGQLKNLTQVIGNYFDTLYLQIEAMKDIHVPTYQTSSGKALPFANRLLESKGFINSEIFANADVLEAVMNRDGEREFSDDLHNVKNLIYQNIYNNLVHIFKTKGTEKSFQNLIRSFGVDEELIRINLYADNTTQLLRDNFRPKAVKKNFVDFYQSDNQDAVVTHQTSSQVGTDISSVASTATITVADGDAASGMTEKEHITLRSTDGTIKRYVITNAASDGSTATGTVLSDSGNTDTGAGTAGAAEDGGVAVSINLSSATQNAFLVQLKAAIEHADGHNGKITVSAVPGQADGAQSITLTQSAVGAIGNTTTETDIDQLTAGNFTGAQNNPDSIGVTYISASHRDISTTAESEVIFPRFKQSGDIGYTEVAFTDSSIFGWDQADPDPDDYIKPSGGSGYQVLAIRPTNDSKDAYFKLVDRANDTTIATSSLYKDVYDDQRWTFALRTRNVMTSSVTPTDPATSHGMGTFLTGAIEGTATATVTVVGGTAANGMTEKQAMTITSVDGTTRVYVIVDDAATTVATGDALTTTSDTGANQAGTLALRANIIDLAGAQSNNDRFKVNVPVALGGTGNDITIRVVAPADPSDGTANEIQVGLGSVVTTRNRVVLAINGLDSSVVQYGSGAGDVTNGIAGITAAAGTGDGDITITATVPGTAGDSITFTDIAGTAIASGDTGASPATLAGGAEVTANSVAVAINTTTGGGATLSTQHAFLVQLKAAIEGSTGHNGEITVSAVAPINSDAQTITLTEAYSGPSGAQTITKNIANTTVSGFASLENGTHVEVSLYGVHTAYDRIQEEFALSGNAIHSDITVPRRYYVGARRTNVTGTVNEKSSVRVGYLRHWQMYLDNKVIQAHARDTENYGTSNPMRSAYLLETPLTGVWMPEASALALNWDFSSVTGSDPSGEFIVQDFSSGSLLKRRFRDPDIDPIVNNQYNGRGYFFKTNTTAAVDTNYISSARYQLPEVMTSHDMIEIRNQDDLVFTKESRPISHYFAFEKSMYQTISEEMINMFAGITEFNNLIGEPVNRYRHEYKDMSKLRQIFYENVENTPDLDKYLSYYKWLDTALGEMLQQLVPASSRFSDDIRNVIEDTVLTRNKYRHILPTLRTPSTEVEGQIKGIYENIYNWRIGHAPMNNKGTKVVHPQPQNQNCLWWRHRAERMGASITSDTAPVNRPAAQVSIIDEQRELYKRKGYSFVSASVPQFTTLPGTPATYTLVVADGDAASGMTEKEHITLISTDGTTKRYVITNAASDGATDTGTILVDADNTDTGGSTAGSDEDGGIAVSINLSSATQNAFLVALKTAVEHPNGHNGKILVSSVPVQADGEQLITLTQSVHGASGNTSVTTNISQITAANFINGTDHPTKVGVNNIPIYTGSYYPNNRFSRPYRLFVGLGFNSTSVIGAWNGQLQAGHNPATGPNTKYTYWRNSTDPADATKLIEVINIIDHTGCEDEDKLPIAGTFPSRKIRPGGVINLTATSKASPTSKANNLPFSLYKSDVTTGYKSSISNVNIVLNDGTTTAGGLELNNIHQDVIETGEASMQGPFTEKYVGGFAHRHVDLNTSLDNPTNRAEGFVVVPAADSIQVRAPSAASDDRAALAPEVRADHYRNVKVKRPVNLGNIRQLTGSSQLNHIGNFTSFREVIQISDRDTNNRAFVKHEGRGPFHENSRANRKGRGNVNLLTNNLFHGLGEFKDVAKPNFYISGSSNKENSIISLGSNQFAESNTTDYTIIERFSAPGGPETAGDSMGGAALDFGSAQYSPYNNINYRNLSVRLPLRRLLTDHANQFGFKSDASTADQNAAGAAHDAYNPSTVSSHDYSGVPAFHNVNRNSTLRYENSGSRTAAETVIRAQTHDNYYVQREIPQSDTQYAWITASLTHIPGHQTTVLGHPHPDGMVSSSVAFDYGLAQGANTAIASTTKTVGPGFIPALNFVSASDVVSKIGSSGERRWLGPGGNLTHGTNGGADKRAVNSTYSNGFFPTDFVGMNGNVRQAINTGSLILSGAAHAFHTDLPQIGTAPFYRAAHLYINSIEGSDTGEFTQITSEPRKSDTTVLNALNLNRNGPYGYPTWKQIRTGETRIGRYLRRNNIISYNETPGRQFVIEDSGRGRQEVLERFGKLRQFREPAVVSRYKPAKFTLGMEQTYMDEGVELTATRPVEIKASYGNNLSFFSNVELDAAKGFIKEAPIGYKTISNFYLRGGLNSPTTPVKSFINFSYGETLYPREENTYMRKSRTRNTFANNFWKDNFADRLALGQSKVRFDGTTADDIDLAGAAKFSPKQLKRSSWDLDGVPAGQMLTASVGVFNFLTGSEVGLLQHRSAMIHYGTKTSMSASVMYARPHMLETTGSLRSFAGPDIPESGSASMILAGKPMGRMKIFGGITAWEAGKQAGVVNDDGEFVNRPTTPFYNSYEDYSEDIRAIAKDYSIVPEFRISEHVDFYVKNKQGDFLAQNPKLLSIFGSPTGSTVPQNSSEDEFFKVYSNSDFMKHFATVKNEHKEIANPSEITLTCKAAMKFLPYNGFYPSERTVEIATQFSKSYGSSMMFAGSDTIRRAACMRPVVQAMFAPGVLYNTIKSGLAVDYPIYTSSYTRHNPRDTGDSNVNTNYIMMATASSPRRDAGNKIAGWDYRVPFESLVEPERYLTNLPIVDMEVHPSSAMDLTASWSGQGDNLYKMMSSNFLAAVPEFFLPSGELTTIKSKPQKQFRSLETGSVYGMRIKLKKSYNRGRQPDRLNTYLVPQDTLPDCRSEVAGTPSLRETFTMYSRPTAFGPPVSGRYMHIGGTHANRVHISDSLTGVNPSFTPPYYDGEAWCDVLFHPSSSFATLGDILAESKKIYWRFDKLAMGQVSNNLHPNGNVNINKFAMQLSSSFNLFQSIREPNVEYDKDGNVISVGSSEDANSVWVMQPKFETPMYNFADTGVHPITNAAGNLIIPTNNSESVTRGMWHQFGVIPTDPNKGIFLEIDDIPENFLKNRIPAYVSSSVYASVHAHDGNAASFDDSNYKGFYGGAPGSLSRKPFKSLLDIVQFDEKTVKLGQTAEKVRASEAIVAVPFIEDAGVRKFFNIDKALVDKVIQDPNTEEVGNSIKQTIKNLDKFVVPPTMDFLAFRDKVDPIAMYFFDFEFEFNQDDLAHMWQNLMPPTGKIVKKSEVKVGHKLLLNELLGNAGSLTGEAIDNKLKWMVFKVKQRANMNYFSKVAGTDADADPRYRTSFQAGRTGESANPESKFSYNWPFDFFSMIEMVKLESEIKFAPQVQDIDSALIINTEVDSIAAGVTTSSTVQSNTGTTTTATTTVAATTSQPQSTATNNQIFNTNQIEEY